MINQSEILARYARNEVTAEEHAAFQEWLKTLSADQLEVLMDEYGDMIAQMETKQGPANPTLLAAIHQEINDIPQPVIRRISFRKWGQAAAVALLLAAGTYYWTTRQAHHLPVTLTDIAPGSEGAILTLADGTSIPLDSAHAGKIASQGGATASLSGNSLIYDKNGTENVFNTMSTPNGRQFQLVLPDGTKVWLNAASAVRYPTVFTGNERHVDVTGEAYFEVAPDAGKPFSVNVNNKATIEVLGTNFNVNAYNNEEMISTTLLEGSVRVGGIIIKPGQQAQIVNQSGGQVKVVENANVEKAIAWKNGWFNFENVPLQEAMRQLERWYDIRVVYEKGVPDVELAGKMTRGVTLRGLLVVLEELGVHNKLECNTLTILP